jgi:hypothetical protein
MQLNFDEYKKRRKSIALENKDADLSKAIFQIVSEIEKKYN